MTKNPANRKRRQDLPARRARSRSRNGASLQLGGNGWTDSATRLLT